VAEPQRARGYDVVTPDLAGHGRAAGTRADLWGAAELLAREVGPARWVGYSLGGRVALHLALARPEVVDRLVLVSATAGIADAAERAERRRADADLADELERDGVAAFVERWLEGPLWATLPQGRAGVEHRLTNTAAGLASSLRLAGAGAQVPLWDRLRDVGAPVLVVTGGEDAKFGALGKELAAGIPDASHTVLDGAGHAAPWEQPERFVEVLDAWLRQ
jgi:2-succinyl-6-hydroxy-2,4-cyclohexadiene-1-carboxylate synthase